MDDIDKAEVIGNLFKATIQEGISLDDFLKLCSIVDRIYILDLKGFCFRYDHTIDDAFRDEIRSSSLEFYSTEANKNLSSLGLMNETIKAVGNLALQSRSNELRYSFEYKISPLGNTMVKYAKPAFRNPLR